MQTAMNGLSASQGNVPLNIEVEAVSGGGDFTLDISGKTFDPLSSCHVRYNGTADTLTIRNTNGSNCSIISAPFGGSIELFTEVTITITVQDATDLSDIENARVYLLADAGGDLTEGTLIVSALTNSSGVVTFSFDYSSNQPVVGYARKGTSSPLYIEGTISGTITSEGMDQTVLLIPDE